MEVLTKERLEQFLDCSGLHSSDKLEDEFARCVDYLFGNLKPYLKECEICNGRGEYYWHESLPSKPIKLARCSCKPERRKEQRRRPPYRRASDNRREVTR